MVFVFHLVWIIGQLKFEEWDLMRTQTVFVSATPGPWSVKKQIMKYIDQIIRPTGLIDPSIEN